MAPLRVACVIPTYNGRKDLERLLDSLATQTASFDTLIVDSSSSDGTLELAQAGVSVFLCSGWLGPAVRQALVLPAR
ncbi:glycosyltransferase family 2 protein, partial [Pseudomonas amygdali]